MISQTASSIQSTAAARTEFKKAVEKIVTPLIGMASMVFWITYVDITSPYPAIGIALSILTAILNISWTRKTWSLNIGGKRIDMRSDQADLFRWASNLAILDPAIILLMNPDAVGFLVVWIILLIGAVCDMFESRFRSITAAIGITTGMATFIYVHGHHYRPMQLLFFAVCLGSISAALLACFRMWEKALNEIELHHIERQRIERDLFKSRSESMIGQQSRAIAHEIKNILGVMTLALELPDTNSSKKEAILQRTVDKMSRVSSLMMNSAKIDERRVSKTFSQLIEDVRMVIGSFARGQNVDLRISAFADVESVQFEEYDGTLYLILHNLIKNGIEALPNSLAFEKRIIELSVQFLENSKTTVRMTVQDHGCGMDEQKLRSYLTGVGETTKEFGHGLGGKFIVDRCAQNGFKLGGHSKKDIGTSIWIDVPTLDSVK